MSDGTPPMNYPETRASSVDLPLPTVDSTCDRCGKSPQPGVYIIQGAEGWVHDPQKNPCMAELSGNAARRWEQAMSAAASLMEVEPGSIEHNWMRMAGGNAGGDPRQNPNQSHEDARKPIAAAARDMLKARLQSDGYPTLDVLSSWYRYAVIAETGVDPGW